MKGGGVRIPDPTTAKTTARQNNPITVAAHSMPSLCSGSKTIGARCIANS